MAFFFTNMFKLLEKNLPKIVIAPAVGLISWFVYGFVLWTLYISFTNSKILPKYELWGTGQYTKLWRLHKWHIAIENLLIFTILFLLICTIIGVLLAIFLDQKIRSEGFLRTVYLYPMALSFIVTGTAWRWILNPTLGIQKLFNDWGFENFTFDLLRCRNKLLQLEKFNSAAVNIGREFRFENLEIHWRRDPKMRQDFLNPIRGFGETRNVLDFLEEIRARLGQFVNF